MLSETLEKVSHDIRFALEDLSREIKVCEDRDAATILSVIHSLRDAEEKIGWMIERAA